MTVQRRMFLGLLSVVIVFVVATNFIVQTLLREIAEREILIKLENAVVAYSRFDEQRQELLTTRAMSVALTAHLVATLAIPDVDAETVRIAGQYLEGVSNLELLLILNDAGELMTDVNEMDATAVGTDFESAIQQALAGDAYFGHLKFETGLYQVAIAPVISNYQVLGLVAAGQRIDDVAAIGVAEDISGATVTWSYALVEQSSPAISHEHEAPLPGVKTARAIAGVGEEIRMVDGALLEKPAAYGSLLFKASVSYPSLQAALVFHQELDLAKSGVATVRKFVLICSVVVILLGMGLCYWIASKISGPIVRLTYVTTDFGKGNFDIRLEPSSGDEVGALTMAFNAMAEEIVEQRQDLLSSLDAAEAANRAKSEFLARMSHEIRTPMNGVLGMAELLLTSDINQQQREYALTILDSSDGLMTIINDVLDFSKIEAGRLELNMTQFSVYEAVAETAALLINHAEGKGLKLNTPIRADEDLWVIGDKLRFKQILMNLIGNAVKFTQDGQITIKTDKVDDTDNDVTLRIEVTDTGVGIQTEDLAHIFDSFTQVDGTDSRSFGGTGLGLPISKELVELMDGQIGARSEVGKGSTFWFQVTLNKITNQHLLQIPNGAAESNLLLKTDLPLSLSVRSVEPLRCSPGILLAEDNVANQKVAITMLRMLGCEIDLVEDGQKALHKTKDHSYDMILMDCQMPVMDGFAATAAIRDWEAEHEVAKPIPIIAVTANALVTDRERCLSAGMSDYISKPFRLADLRAGIERWLPEDRLIADRTPDSAMPIIGISELDELRELGASKAELEEIVTCYIESSADSINQMRAAIDSRDRETLRSLAHKLKGGCGQVGAHKAAKICLELNTEATDACWETLARMFAGLTEEIGAANEELNALLSRESA